MIALNLGPDETTCDVEFRVRMATIAAMRTLIYKRTHTGDPDAMDASVRTTAWVELDP